MALTRVALAVLALTSAYRASAQDDLSPRVTTIPDLSAGWGPAAAPKVAMLSPAELAVVWSVEDGEAPGVYVRRRSDFLWEPEPVRLSGEAHRPRDVDAVYDAGGKLHVVWTGIDDRARTVFHATLHGGEIESRSTIVNAGDASDADYPDIEMSAGGGLIVWQASAANGFSVRAAGLNGDGGLKTTLLPAVSADSRSALNPQILRTEPPLVTWTEVQEASSTLRASAWTEGSWADAAIELPPAIQALDGASPSLLLDPLNHVCAVWGDRGEAGGALRMEWSSPMAPEKDGSIRLDDPAGEHGDPSVMLNLLGGAVATWQVLRNGEREIQAAFMDSRLESALRARVSPPDHRFASRPAQASAGLSTFVVWIDDARQGGSGDLGFAEVRWPFDRILRPLAQVAP